MALEKEKTPDSISRRWMSRAVMSLKTSEDEAVALFRGICTDGLAALKDTLAS